MNHPLARYLVIFIIIPYLFKYKFFKQVLFLFITQEYEFLHLKTVEILDQLDSSLVDLKE